MADEETPRSDDDDRDIDPDQFDQGMRDLNLMFSKFKDDPDSDFISVDSLTGVLQAFGRNPSLRESQQRINQLEAEGKNELSLEDVLQIAEEPWTTVNNDRDVLRQAFEKFDETQEGYIDIERFRTVMSTLGEALSDEELEDLIQLGLNDEQTKINIDYLLDQLLGNSA